MSKVEHDDGTASIAVEQTPEGTPLAQVVLERWMAEAKRCRLLLSALYWNPCDNHLKAQVRNYLAMNGEDV